jgi:hypothetical protein
MVNERRWLILIFALYFLLAVGYSLLMPIWEAPDEYAHYHLSWHFTYTNEYATQELNYEAHQPRMYYYFGAGIIRALNQVDPQLARYFRPEEFVFNIRVRERRFDWNDENYRFLWGMYILRWINIIFGGVALWLNWKTFKQITPEKGTLCLAALALAALTPQYLHIMSSVNNDAPGTLAGAFLFYLTVRSAKDPSNRLSILSVILAILLPFMTKLTVLPISAAVLTTNAWKWISERTQKRWLFYLGILVLLGIGIFCFLFPEAVQSAATEIKWRLFSFRKNAFTSKYINFIVSQIVWTYWGKVGWLAVGLPYWIVDLLSIFGLIGMALHAYKLMQTRATNQKLAVWFATWLVAGFTILAVLRNGLTTRATQGRLLFPAIGAISLLMIAGWHETLPERFQPYLPAFIVLLFFCCNMILWLTGILPVYYQPFLD